MSGGEISLGVVVLTYGTGGEHGALVDSLRGEGVLPQRVVVVHNPAAPDEPDPEVPAGCEVVRSDRNRGYAGGMNLGLERWRTREGGVELLLLLTHDARLRPGALSALLDVAGRHPEYGVLAPALAFVGTDTPFSYGGATSANGFNSHLKDPAETDDGVAPCDWVDGGTLLLRRQLLDRVGDFDERLWSYCEEADLCLRVRRAGFLVGVVLDAVADQEPGGTKRPGAWSYLLTRNGIAYARRAAGLRGLLCVTVSDLLHVGVCLARVAVRGVRLRKGSPAEPWALAAGTARGIADYYRGRWGPPPTDLPGMGDVSNA